MQFDETKLMETTLSSERVYDGKIIHIDMLVNRLPNGAEAFREIARHPGASAVVPLDQEGNVYFVRQFRAPFDKILLEIPAGKLDYMGEDRLLAAKRELGEETGFTAESWTFLTDVLTTVGFCDERISLYLAEGLKAGETHPDDDEFLNIVVLPLEEAYQMAMRGEIGDSKTQIGILMAHALRGK